MFGNYRKLRLILSSVLFLGFVFMIFLNTNPIKSTDDFGSIEIVEITVLVDNYPNGTLQNPWGVSMLLETSDYTILFDTGSDPNALGNNSIALGKDLSLVDYVIISHEHPDHLNGLEYVADVNPGITIYVPNNIGTTARTDIENLGFNVVGIQETTVISLGIAIIGQIWGPPYEIAMVVNIANVGIVTLVGCSHPGVENHVEKAVTDLAEDPYLVIGGFHLLEASVPTFTSTTTTLLDAGVDYIYPIHCSGGAMRSYVETNHPEHYGEGRVGTNFIIDQSLATQAAPIGIILTVVTLITMPIIHKKIKKKKD